ncbi:MAG TPA: hypothetical protein VH275_10355 [Solirubrobacterales bacterium]|jgi:hypothetical protein|nr:hypothetical protein [Solirubrobacterales bacterium]
MHQDDDLADRQRVTEEAEAAAAEAARIGGRAPTESDDPAQQPLIESGQGESEGFELAEKRLQDIASHGDERSFPDRDVPPPEEGEQAEHGEADQTIPPDG